MRNIFKHTFPALAACALLAASCSDWTKPESVELQTSTIESQNPELYAQYVEAVKQYKGTAHQILIATVDNTSENPSSRSQHLTDLPDSTDYICLANVAEVSQVNQEEMTEVRKLGTQVLGLVDFDAIEAAWETILENEENSATDTEATDDGETEDEATRFINYCSEKVATLISTCNALGLDGIVVNFTGFDLNSLIAKDDMEAETARQAAFFDAVANWKAANADKALVFKGMPQNLVDKTLLENCKYIILNGHSVQNTYEMSYLVTMASIDGVPTDRFVMGVTTPYLTNSGAYNGELSDGSSAIIAAAQWAVATEEGFTKAGVSVDSAQEDYFNYFNVYPNIKEAINIMNPTAK